MYADLGFSTEAGRFPEERELVSVMFPKLMKVNVKVRMDPGAAGPPGNAYGFTGLQASPPPIIWVGVTADCIGPPFRRVYT